MLRRSLVVLVCSATANAGQARSRGAEFELAYHWSDDSLGKL